MKLTIDKTLSAALSWVDIGAKVYPLAPGSRSPLKGSHGEHDATNDIQTINRWFDSTGNNLAINLKESGLAVIDLDRHNVTEDGVKAWRDYLLNHGDTYTYMDSLQTYVESTPRAGIHLFYRYNDGDLKKSDIELMPGVELITDKIIVAPSINKEVNHSYQFLRGNIDNILPLPDWTVALAREAQKKPKHKYTYTTGRKTWAGALLDEMMQGATTGNRHNWLVHIAGKLKWTNSDTINAYRYLMMANQHCDRPLPDREVENIFVSIFKK